MSDEITYRIKFDAKAALTDLHKTGSETFPYVLAKSLTRTAEGGQGLTRFKIREKFKLHGDFITRGIRIKPSLKSDVQHWGIAQSEVFTAPIISGFMPLHETGEDKVPHGKALAIPSRGFKASGVVGSTGKIKKSQTPAELLKQFNKHQPRARVRSRKQGTAFILKGRIVKRLTKARYPLVTLYTFKPSAHIKKRLEMEKSVTGFADSHFEKIFKQEWEMNK